MTIRHVFSTVCVGVCLLAAACTATDSGVKKDGPPAAEVKAEAAPAAQPAQAAQAPAEKKTEAPAAQLSVAEIQRRRDLERELLRDHEAYMRLISQKNVNAALDYVAPEIRTEMQTELWRFVGEYSFDSFEVVAKDVQYWSTSTEADVKAVLVVYQKNVVAPSKKDFATKWKRFGDRWLIRP